jgi:hypothetical protein
MRKHILVICILFVVLSPVVADGQHHKVLLHPPEPADTQATSSTGNTDTSPKKHFDGVQVGREARELSDLAKSIPLDVEHVNQGMMPKDMIEKLKRIERLSKHLRSEVSSQ